MREISGLFGKAGKSTYSGEDYIDIDGSENGLRELVHLLRVGVNSSCLLGYKKLHQAEEAGDLLILDQITIDIKQDDVMIALNGNKVIISGSPEKLRLMSNSIERLFKPTFKISHTHFEYFPGHPLLHPESIPLIVSSVMQEFKRSYNWEVRGGIPGTGYIHQFHRPDHSFHREGFVVKVFPEAGKPWIGNFQKGDVSFSGVSTTPSLGVICIAAGGEGYLVTAANPEEYQIIHACPIMGMWPIPNHQILVFANFTELIAYGPDGIKWKTPRIAADGIWVDTVTEDTIEGMAWIPWRTSENNTRFVVDLATGTPKIG